MPYLHPGSSCTSQGHHHPPWACDPQSGKFFSSPDTTYSRAGVSQPCPTQEAGVSLTCLAILANLASHAQGE